jgi:hypothetical protein
MVAYPGFSERIFEFAFNAEFVTTHSAVLAACPTLPSLQEEKKLGYDVAFELKCRGGSTDFLFLQHKVARYVSTRHATNKHFFDFAGPYFAFVLDNDQYNLIYGLANRGRQIYFCAPSFTSRRDIDKAFSSKSVCNDSVWLDVTKTGPIKDNHRHTIIYAPTKAKAALFSEEPREIEVLNPGAYTLSGNEDSAKLDVKDARKLHSDVAETFREWWPANRRRPPRPAPVEQTGQYVIVPKAQGELQLTPKEDAERIELLEDTATLLAEWFGVSWIIVCKHNPSPEESLPTATGSKVSE